MGLKLCSISFLFALTSFVAGGVEAQSAKGTATLTSKTSKEEKVLPKPLGKTISPTRTPIGYERSVSVTEHPATHSKGVKSISEKLTPGWRPEFGPDKAALELNGKSSVGTLSLGEVTTGELPLLLPGIYTTTVIAIQNTYGANGPQMLTKLALSIDGGDFGELGSGSLVPSDTFEFDIPEGASSFALRGSAANPANQLYSYHATNTDPVQAITLIAGDNLSAQLQEHGVRPPFGSQTSIDQILTQAGYLNAGGTIVLDQNDILILFELGTSNPQSSAYDLNDLIIHLRAPTPVDRQFSIYDGGPTIPANTNARTTFTAYRSLTYSTYLKPVVSVTSTRSGYLRQLRAVVTQIGTQGNVECWEQSTELHMHSSYATFSSDMLNPDLGVYQVGNFIVSRELIGSNSGGWPNFLYTFDLTPFNIPVAAGQNFLFGIQTTSGTGPCGSSGVAESAVVYTPVGWQGSPNFPAPFTRLLTAAPGGVTGTLALELTGTESDQHSVN
jgi:hypothetical protein